MTWTTISRVDAGDDVTSAAWNAQVKGNLEHLYSVPRCEVYKSGNQSINDASYTSITWDSETFDTASIHSTVSNTERLTLVRAGTWLVVAQVKFSGSSVVGDRRGVLRVNGTDADYGYFCEANPSGDHFHMVGGVIYTATTTDYVELRVYQNSGAALNFEGGSAAASSMSATWIGN